MRLEPKQTILVLGLVALLAACSGPSNTNTQPMSAAEAKAAADVAVNDLSLSGALVGGPAGLVAQYAQILGIPVQAATVLEGLGMDLTQAITVGCTFDFSPEVPVDADKDLVPANFSLSVDCKYTDTGSGFTYAFKGSLKIEDTNDNLKNSGFKLALQNFIEEASKGADSFKRTFDGSYTLDTQNTSLFKAEKGYTASHSYTKGTQSDSANSTFSISETYAPDSALTPLKAGTFTVDEAKPGTLTVVHGSKTYNWKGNTKPTLHYNSACKARTPNGVRIPFDSGAAFYSYTNPGGKVSTLEIKFSACGSFTVTLDGQGLQ